MIIDQDNCVWVVHAGIYGESGEVFFFTDRETFDLAMPGLFDQNEYVDGYLIYDGKISNMEIVTRRAFIGSNIGEELDLESEIRFDCPDDIENAGRWV